MPVECEYVGEFLACRCGSLVGGKVLAWTRFYRLGSVLFDAGCANTAGEIAEAVGRLRAVLITHHHEDHVGAARLLSRYAEVYAPAKSLGLLANPPRIPEYRRLVWGQPEPVEAKPLTGELTVGGLRVRVIETPGHSFDHVSFLVDEYLFCGDLVLPPRQMVAMRGEDLVETMRSLERILRYRFEYALGGTGIYAREDVKAYLEYLRGVRERALELHEQGLSPEEIVEKLFPSPPARILLMEEFSGGEWSRVNFVKSLLRPDRP